MMYNILYIVKSVISQEGMAKNVRRWEGVVKIPPKGLFTYVCVHGKIGHKSGSDFSR